MTGYESKRAAAQDKLLDDDDALTIAYQSGYYDGKKAAQPAQEPMACIGTNGELMWLNKPRVIYSKPIPLYTTPPQPAQEPVAWITPDGGGFRIRFSPPTNDVPLGWDAFYTAPPQRLWVGLTDDEIDELSRSMVKGDKSVNWLCQAIEAKLKEKNDYVRPGALDFKKVQSK